MEKDGINSFGAYLELITNRNPVVHQITNFVTANDWPMQCWLWEGAP